MIFQCAVRELHQYNHDQMQEMKWKYSVGIDASFLGALVKTGFLLENERRHKLPWSCTQEDWCPQRRLWGASGTWARVSAGGLKKICKESHWKDKCEGTLGRTQKWKPSPGNNIKFYSPWTCSRFILLILSRAHNVTVVLPCVCSVVGVLQYTDSPRSCSISDKSVWEWLSS